MNRNSIFWGAILVLAGILFLLDNLGILRVDVWNLLWPLFLIALGVSFLWGTIFRSSAESEHANVPLEGAGRARVRVNHGAGRLSIYPGADPSDLLVGDFGGGLDLNTRRDGDLLDVHLRMPAQNFPFFMWGSSQSLDWSFGLTRDVPISLELETGANDSRVDLSELRVTDLRLKSGASSTNLTLPANAGHTRADIETGAASVNVHIPSGVAARIRARGGLASINIDGMRFPRSGDIYQSSDWDSASNRVDLDIQTGVGSVSVN